jgi:hypothetical protein
LARHRFGFAGMEIELYEPKAGMDGEEEVQFLEGIWERGKYVEARGKDSLLQEESYLTGIEAQAEGS